MPRRQNQEGNRRADDGLREVPAGLVPGRGHSGRIVQRRTRHGAPVGVISSSISTRLPVCGQRIAARRASWGRSATSRPSEIWLTRCEHRAICASPLGFLPPCGAVAQLGERLNGIPS